MNSSYLELVTVLGKDVVHGLSLGHHGRLVFLSQVHRLGSLGESLHVLSLLGEVSSVTFGKVAGVALVNSEGPVTAAA